MATSVTTVRRETPGEKLANALTHGVGAALSVVGLVLLIVRTSANGDPWRVVGSTVFGVSMVLLYSSSALYHSLDHTPAHRRLQALDHSLIFVLIAGTYTPFMLGPLRGPWGWSLFGCMWGMAVLGIVSKVFYSHRFQRASTLLYLAMGWIGLTAIDPLLRHVPPEALYWLLAGGLAYSLGTLFYGWRSQRYHHAIWHLFVLAGTGAHFVAIYGYLS